MLHRLLSLVYSQHLIRVLNSAEIERRRNRHSTPKTLRRRTTKNTSI